MSNFPKGFANRLGTPETMDWEQKFAALQSLCDCSLRMRKPGDWYVNVMGAEVKDGDLLVSPNVSGVTPAEAIEKTWEAYTGGKIVVIDAGRPTRRSVVWTGYMWRD